MPQKPIDFIPESPIDFQPDKEPGVFSKAWDWLWTPPESIAKPMRAAYNFAIIPQKLLDEAYNKIDPRLSIEPETRNTIDDVTKGLATGLFAPGNLGMMALTGGASATTNIAPALSRGLTTASRFASAPFIGTGAYNALTADNPLEVGLGLADIAGGIAGAKFKPHTPTIPDVNKISPEVLQFGKHILGGPSVDEIAESLRPAAQMGAFTDVSRRLPAPSQKTRFFAGKNGIADAENVPAIDLTDFAKFKKQDGTRPIDFEPTEPFGPIDKDILRSQDTLPLTEFETPNRPSPIFAAEEQLMGKSNLPNETGLFDEPQFARAEGGGVKIGADINSLSKVLGSSLYEGNIAKIATKELLQNSIDAVRPLGPNGNVNVTISSNRSRPFIEVSDNGRGMTRAELETVFTDLGASGKRSDASAIGGFGLAKAAPLLGGDEVVVTSIVKDPETGKLIGYEFNGTPDELIAGVEIDEFDPIPGTPTGTTVRTYVPKDTMMWQGEEITKAIGDSSPGYEGKINLKQEGLFGHLHSDTYTPAQRFKEADITPLSNEFADVELIVPKGTNYGEQTGVLYKILNQGMYQATDRYGWNPNPGIPEELLINIKSKVPEGHAEYPFTANRESLRGETRKQIEQYIDQNFVKPGRTKRSEQLNQVYANMPQVQLRTHSGPKNFYFYDVGNRFTPDELLEFQTNPVVVKLAEDVHGEITDILRIYGNTEMTNKLEKIGFIFDDKVHGIHIPAPGKGKSAIMLNPFISMKLAKDADEAAAGMFHTIMHEIAHIPGGGHDESFASRLADIQTKIGARRSVQGMERIYGTIANPGTDSYNDEVLSLLHRYEERSGRPATSEDPLYGTGIGQSVGRKGQGGNDGNSGQSGAAIARLKQAIADARPIRETQEQLYSQERGKRFSEAAKIRATGFGSVIKKLGKLKGELPKADYSPIKLAQKDVDTLTRLIFSQPALQEGEKIRAAIALGKIVGKTKATGVPQRGELALLETVLGKETVGEIRELYAGLGVLPYEGLATDIVNIPKSLMSSSDLSAPLRQGIGMVTMPEFWTSFDDMFKSFGSQKAYDGVMASIDDKMLDIGRRLGMPATDAHMVAKRIGLSLTDLSENLNMREESAMSRLVGKLPWVKSANRAYVAFLNKLRVDSFDSLLKGMESWYGGAKQDEVAIKELARFINGATGRGSLDFSKTPVVGKFLGDWEDSAANLNNIFFSPRLIASRVQGLNPWNYVNPEIPGYIRLQYLRSLAGVAGIGSLITGLAYVGGATVDDNPTSADFGKARIGNTRIDPYGGFQQYIVAMNRLRKGEQFSTTTGRTNHLNTGRFNAPTRTDVMIRFGRSKLNPIVGFAWDILEGKDMGGNPVQVTPALANLFIPMIVNDTYQLIQEQPELFGANAVAAAIALGSLGVGTQTYNRPNVGQDVMAGLEQAPPYRTRFSNNGPGPLYDMIQGQ